jgi:hypothetical protein
MPASLCSPGPCSLGREGAQQAPALPRPPHAARLAAVRRYDMRWGEYWLEDPDAYAAQPQRAADHRSLQARRGPTAPPLLGPRPAARRAYTRP